MWLGSCISLYVLVQYGNELYIEVFYIRKSNVLSLRLQSNAINLLIYMTVYMNLNHIAYH